MSLSNARADIDRITQAGFGVDLVFTAPDFTVANVRGLASRHHLSIDPETGQPVNSNNIHVSVSERLLAAASYPYLDSEGEIYMVNHKVAFEGKTYLINENFPDETLGLIVCILGEFE